MNIFTRFRPGLFLVALLSIFCLLPGRAGAQNGGAIPPVNLAAPAEEPDRLPPRLRVSGAEQPVRLVALAIRTEIKGGFAESSLDMEFHNPNRRVLEGELEFPLTPGQEISGLALDIGGELRRGVPVAKARGQEVFEEVARRQVDPAFLEATRGNAYRLRVYPLPAGGARRVVVRIMQPLTAENGLWRYRLPLGLAEAVDSVSIEAEVVSPAGPIRAEAGNLGLRLEKSGTVFRGRAERRNISPEGWLDITLPARLWGRYAIAGLAALPVDPAYERDGGGSTFGRMYNTDSYSRLRDAPRSRDGFALGQAQYMKASPSRPSDTEARLSQAAPGAGRPSAARAPGQEPPATVGARLKPWVSDAPYITRMKEAKDEELYAIYLDERPDRFGDINTIALTEMNALIAASGGEIRTEAIDSRLIANLPADIRVVLSWDLDNTDMDLWITGPDGEAAYYRQPRTRLGGRLSRDCTRGYGPEEFMLKKAAPGLYRVAVDYYGHSRQTIAGEVTMMVTVFSKFGTPGQKQRTTTLRLKKNRELISVAEFLVEE